MKTTAGICSRSARYFASRFDELASAVRGDDSEAGEELFDAANTLANSSRSVSASPRSGSMVPLSHSASRCG